MRSVSRLPALLLLLFVLLSCGALLTLLPTFGKSDLERLTAVQIERERADLELEQARQDHAGNRTILYSLVALVAGLVGTWSLVTAYNYHQDRCRQRELLMPDENGLYPIDARQLSRDVAQQVALILAGGAMQSAVERARAGVAAPHTYTYAPRITGPAPAPHAPLMLADEQAAPSIVLPDTALLSDHIATLGRGKLAYGVLPGGQPLVLPLAAGYHILAHGDTRSGKTNFIDGMLTQLHHQRRHYGLRIIAGDFKRELAATWRRSALLEAVETEPGAIAEMLEELVRGQDGILNRYSQFEQLGAQSGRIIRNIADYTRATGEQPELTFVVIDEINAVLEACDRKASLASALKQVLQTGAGAGIYILGGAQYLSSSVFKRDGSKQFVTRAHFGAYDQVAVRMMFSRSLDDEARELVTGQPGRGLIKTVQQPDPQPFQALRCDEEDILAAIDLVRSGATTVGERATTPSATPSATDPATGAFKGATSPLQWAKGVFKAPASATPIPASAARDEHASTTPAVAVAPEERAAILTALGELQASGEPVSRRAVCRRAFGTTGGAGYYKVQAVLAEQEARAA